MVSDDSNDGYVGYWRYIGFDPDKIGKPGKSAITFDVISMISGIIMGGILALGEGVISTISAAGQLITTSTGVISSALSEVVRLTVGVPQSLIEGAWAGAAIELANSGIVGYLLAVLIVGVSLYIVSYGVSRLAG